MQPNFNLDPSKLKDRLFKIKKLHFNTYEIDHSEIKGQLRLVTLPLNLLEVPADQLPPNANTGGMPVFMVGSQTLAAFSNKGKRHPINVQTADNVNKAKRIDLTNFVVQEQSYEPWNEFVIQGNPPLIIKLRTIMTRVEWLQGLTNPIGDPALNTNSDTTHSVSIAATGEAGMP